MTTPITPADFIRAIRDGHLSIEPRFNIHEFEFETSDIVVRGYLIPMYDHGAPDRRPDLVPLLSMIAKGDAVATDRGGNWREAPEMAEVLALLADRLSPERVLDAAFDRWHINAPRARAEWEADLAADAADPNREASRRRSTNAPPAWPPSAAELDRRLSRAT